MFVLVNTYLDHDFVSDVSVREVGAVYGPFDSKEAAVEARDEMEFDHPEWVLVRTVHTP